MLAAIHAFLALSMNASEGAVLVVGILHAEELLQCFHRIKLYHA